jgi:NADPH2:quinone reductase
MKNFQISSTDSPPKIVESDVPTPGSGQVLVRITACGLNFADLLMSKGTYQDTPAVPFTLGMEIAGIVERIGDGVTQVRTGQRVAVFTGSGGLAEYGVFDAARCLAIPERMSDVHAAAFQVAYGTSHLALDNRARLQPGETLLVLGAAGGVGLAAVEIGKLMGANVIAVARGSDKLAVAKQAGADHLIDSDTQNIRDEVRALGGADVVYDPVGGDQFHAAMRACNPRARVVLIGFASGDIPQIPANILLVKNITVIGYYWGGYAKFAPGVLSDSLKTLMGWYDQGKLRPHVSHVLPLERAQEALDLLASRKSTGKVVVTP